jgi:hypothetical protein
MRWTLPLCLLACGDFESLSGGGDWGARERDGASADTANDAPRATEASSNDAGSQAPTDAGATPDAVDASAHQCVTNAPKDCSPGSGSGTANECFDGPSCFVAKVQKAVTKVIAAQPSWFDTNNQWSCPRILTVDAFMNAVVSDLAAQGVCAIRDPNAPGEEVTVKHDNAFSENFDIVASNGCARWGAGIYTGWCAPAWW